MYLKANKVSYFKKINKYTYVFHFFSPPMMNVLSRYVLILLNLRALSSEFDYEGIPADVSVKDLRVESAYEEWLVLAWDLPDAATKWTKDYVISFYDGNASRLLCANEKRLTIADLSPCTTYNITVNLRSTGKDIFGLPATVTASTTNLVPGKISGVRVTPYSDNCLVEWEGPENWNRCVSKYFVRLLSTRPYEEIRRGISSYRKILLSDLTPCREYAVCVVPINANDAKGPEECTRFETLFKNPTPVQFFTISPGNPFVSITWADPEVASSCIDYYELKYCRASNSSSCLSYKISKREETSPEFVKYAFDISIDNFCPCARYDIEIYSRMRSPDLIRIQQSFVAFPRVFAAPNDESWEASARTVKFVWPLDRKCNVCPLLSTLIACRSGDLSFAQSVSTAAGTEEAVADTATITLDHLTPYKMYACRATFRNSAGLSEWSHFIIFATLQDLPDPPAHVAITEVTKVAFKISWDPPLERNGLLSGYVLTVRRLGYSYERPARCPLPEKSIKVVILARNVSEYHFDDFDPGEMFAVDVKASTNAGFGGATNVTGVIAIAASEPVESLEAQPFGENYLLKWKQPCKTNGEADYFKIMVHGSRKRHPDHIFTLTTAVNREDLGINYELELKNLLCEYDYVVGVSVAVKDVKEFVYATVRISVPASIPPAPPLERLSALSAVNPTGSSQAEVTWNRDLFEDSRGDLIFYALIVGRDVFEMKMESDRLKRPGDWPRSSNWAKSQKYDFLQVYQATPEFWNPFRDRNGHYARFVIGANDSCSSNDDDYCNGPLMAGLTYKVMIRAFSKVGYQDSPPISFKTADGGKREVVSNLTSILGILVFSAFFIAGLFFVKSGRTTRFQKRARISYPPEDVAVADFPSVCCKFLNSVDSVRAEFYALGKLSSEMAFAADVSKLPQNRCRNRYANILPFDATRVKLINEPSDYINASYIRGSDKFRYIATQAPIFETCRDFWAMVVQENVRIIVMLCQLYENGKVACEKYYPDVDETIRYNDLTVTCARYAVCEAYFDRIIQITKDGKLHIVRHAHFREWPDFGVPDDPSMLVHFCNTICEIVHDGIVVHCSAGVGRTGVYIACDILLGEIKRRKKQSLNIFNTVLRMREQRANMVQSESQYRFLYGCAEFIVKIVNQ